MAVVVHLHHNETSSEVWVGPPENEDRMVFAIMCTLFKRAYFMIKRRDGEQRYWIRFVKSPMVKGQCCLENEAPKLESNLVVALSACICGVVLLLNAYWIFHVAFIIGRFLVNVFPRRALWFLREPVPLSFVISQGTSSIALFFILRSLYTSCGWGRTMACEGPRLFSCMLRGNSNWCMEACSILYQLFAVHQTYPERSSISWVLFCLPVYTCSIGYVCFFFICISNRVAYFFCQAFIHSQSTHISVSHGWQCCLLQCLGLIFVYNDTRERMRLLGWWFSANRHALTCYRCRQSLHWNQPAEEAQLATPVTEAIFQSPKRVVFGGQGYAHVRSIRSARESSQPASF